MDTVLYLQMYVLQYSVPTPVRDTVVYIQMYTTLYRLWHVDSLLYTAVPCTDPDLRGYTAVYTGVQ
jgi:hypothetical protein